MLRIAICDDVAAYGEILSDIIVQWALERRINVELERFISGEELLADIELAGYYDIILLDINLEGGINGVETAKQIKRCYMHFCLIFISQYDSYYKEVFQVHPFQYLEKPISRMKLKESLNQAIDSYRYLSEVFTFHYRGINYSVVLSEVSFFRSDKRKIHVHMEDGEEHIFYGKLDEVELRLDRYKCRFLRIHKSYMVNARQIKQYHAKMIVMRDESILPISLEKRTEIMRYHMQVLEENI